MTAFHQLFLVFFLLISSSACKARKPGAEDMRRGRELLDSQPSLAIEAYERAGKAGADSLEVKKGVAAAHERLHRFDQATQLLREVLARKADDYEARLALVRIEILQQRFDTARAELEFILPLQPPHIPSLLLYAALAQTPAQGKAGLEALDRLDAKTFAPLLKSAELAFARACLMAAASDEAGASAMLAGVTQSQAINPGLSLGLANAARALKRASFAEWLLARASVAEGAPEEVHISLAEVALAQRHLPLAKGAIAKLRTEGKPEPKALLLLAQYHELNNEPVERAKVIHRALEIFPAEDTAERRKIETDLATALARSGDPKGAAAVLVNLLERDPTLSPALLLLADLRLGQKLPEEAITLATKLEKDAPLRTEAYKILIAAHLQKNDASAAEAAARRFLASSDSSPDSIMLLINLLVHNQRPALALREADAGFTRYPDQIEFIKARLTLTGQVQGFAKADKVALDVARSKKPGVLLEVARFYERAKRFDQALRIYRELVALDPKALVELSQLQDRLGKLADAITSMRDLVKVEPNNANALLRLGMLEERANQAQAATHTYERVLDIDPNSILALNNLVMLLTASPGESQRAVTLARKANAIAGKDPRIADTVGWALVHSDSEVDRAEAVPLLERSSAALRTPESHYHYGASLAAVGNYAEAIAALDQALKPTHSSPWRTTAKKILDDAKRMKSEAPPQPSSP